VVDKDILLVEGGAAADLGVEVVHMVGEAERTKEAAHLEEGVETCWGAAEENADPMLVVVLPGLLRGLPSPMLELQVEEGEIVPVQANQRVALEGQRVLHPNANP